MHHKPSSMHVTRQVLNSASSVHRPVMNKPSQQQEHQRPTAISAITAIRAITAE